MVVCVNLHILNPIFWPFIGTLTARLPIIKEDDCRRLVSLGALKHKMDVSGLEAAEDLRVLSKNSLK